MNRKFGKLIDSALTFAPDSVIVLDNHRDEWDEYADYDADGNGIGAAEHRVNEYDTERIAMHPTAADYLAAKSGPYLAITDTPPETDAEHYAAPTGWEERDGAIVRVYEVRENEPRVRVLSKLKCYGALVEMGAWDAVEAWLKEQGLWTAFILANEVRTDHPQFVAGFAAIKAMLSLTDEQGEAFLGKCEMEA